jgi:putative transposase
MSEPALKLVMPPVDPPASPGSWITSREAATRSGLNLGAINRKCLETWQHDGRAKRERLPNGQQGWLIHESADPRFVLAKSAETKDAIFDPAKLGLTEAQTQEVLRRRKIVSDWSDAVRASAAIKLTERQVTDQYLSRLSESGVALSRATLYNWLAAWRRQGINGLIDARWKSQKSGGDYADFMALVTQLWLDRGTRKPLTVCYAIAQDRAAQNGWTVPSYGTCHRLIKRLDPAYVAKFRHGEKRFVDDHEPNLHRDYSTIDANDWWCSDDRPFDVMVQHGWKENGSPNFIRPVLHAWQDLRSRKCLAWEILADAATTPVVLRTFVNACDAHGVPKVALVDNGKTFDGRALQGRTKRQRQRGEVARKCEGAFNILDVQTVHAWPFHGQSKPIERMFGTIARTFCKLWPTYCGKDSSNRPESLVKRLKAGEAPTLEEFTAAFADWIEPAYNGKAGHRGDAMEERSPNQAFADELKVKRTLPRELLEYATFERTAPVKVAQDGVRYKGLHFGQFDQALAKWHGKQVRLAVDDRCLSHVYVEELNGRLITRAKVNGKIAFVRPGEVNDATLRDAISEKKRLRRSLKQFTEDRPRMTLDVPDLAIRAARNRAERAVTPPVPPSLQPVRTPFDDQFAAIQSAMPGSSAASQRAAELAALDELRPSHMKLAGTDQPAPDDEDVFGAIADAMRAKRHEATA